MSISNSYSRQYDKFMANPTSRARAVKAKCLECVNFEDAVNQVGGCTVTKCPLWAFRPYQDKREPDDLDDGQRAES